MKCPMATDEMGNMRECRTDCAWAACDSGATTCAVSLVALTKRLDWYREVGAIAQMKNVSVNKEVQS